MTRVRGVGASKNSAHVVLTKVVVEGGSRV
jgi:hypothetical protein